MQADHRHGVVTGGALTLAAHDVVATRRAWSRLPDVDAPEGVLDDVRRRLPEWRKGRNHRVTCIVVDAASQHAQYDDSISRGRDVLETAGWTDLRAVGVKHTGARATSWPWPDIPAVEDKKSVPEVNVRASPWQCPDCG